MVCYSLLLFCCKDCDSVHLYEKNLIFKALYQVGTVHKLVQCIGYVQVNKVQVVVVVVMRYCVVRQEK
jgi:hypothetical protein